jgi:rare lipoprotein A (peptidoglycan hydrolase)
LLSLPADPIQGLPNGNSKKGEFQINERSIGIHNFWTFSKLRARFRFPEGEQHMPMTAGYRLLSILALGLLLFATPVQASLEKITRPAPVEHPITTPKAKAAPLQTRFIASWYGEQFQGRETASGEIFDLNKLTAAHKTLPLGTIVKLTVIATGKSVIVRINDRGPFIKGRDFDLSEEAATVLGFHEQGLAAVEATVLHRSSLRAARAQ